MVVTVVRYIKVALKNKAKPQPMFSYHILRAITERCAVGMQKIIIDHYYGHTIILRCISESIIGLGYSGFVNSTSLLELMFLLTFETRTVHTMKVVGGACVCYSV